MKLQTKTSLSWSHINTAPCKKYEALHLAAVAVVCALWLTTYFPTTSIWFLYWFSLQATCAFRPWELHLGTAFPMYTWLCACVHCLMSLTGLRSPFVKHWGCSHFGFHIRTNWSDHKWTASGSLIHTWIKSVSIYSWVSSCDRVSFPHYVCTYTHTPLELTDTSFILRKKYLAQWTSRPK